MSESEKLPEPKCTLTDAELAKVCDEWILKLCKGDKFKFTVPVDFNRDPDMLFTELINRFKQQQQPQPERLPWSEEAIEQAAEEYAELTTIYRGNYYLGLCSGYKAALLQIQNGTSPLRVEKPWINVEDRLPNDGEYVYGLDKRGLQYVIRIYEFDNSFKWMDKCNDYPKEHIVYWMPLFKPPTHDHQTH